MSTLEQTANMLEDLNDEELLSVQWVILNMKKMQGFFQPKSKEEILKRLDESRKQSDAGQCKKADDFLGELRDKYGL